MTEKTDSLCARCAASGYTCCHNTRIILTQGDMARISAAAGGDDFYEYVHAGKPGKKDLETDPIWAGLFAAGRLLRVLRRRPDRSCCFLAADGCRLTLEARPLLCRLYPYEYTHSAITGVHAPYCSEPECGNPDRIPELLGMDRDTAEQWRRDLYREIEEELG